MTRWGTGALSPPDDLAPFMRTDTARVADTSQRPSDLEYARYLWLVQQMAGVGHRDVEIAGAYDFAVKGRVRFSDLRPGLRRPGSPRRRARPGP